MIRAAAGSTFHLDTSTTVRTKPAVVLSLATLMSTVPKPCAAVIRSTFALTGTAETQASRLTGFCASMLLYRFANGTGVPVVDDDTDDKRRASTGDSTAVQLLKMESSKRKVPKVATTLAGAALVDVHGVV